MFRQNTAAFIHEHARRPACPTSTATATTCDTRFSPNAGALDRAKQLAVVGQLTEHRRHGRRRPWRWPAWTWVLLTEAPDGGWGLSGHATAPTPSWWPRPGRSWPAWPPASRPPVGTAG